MNDLFQIIMFYFENHETAIFKSWNQNLNIGFQQKRDFESLIAGKQSYL